MVFLPFELEQFLSAYEQTVEYNYSESGVHPVAFGELLALAGKSMDSLSDVPLNYPEVNGDIELRERIAALYPGAGPENVLVTIGASEANLLAATTLLQPGDEVIALRPTYLQFGGMALNMGVRVRTVDLIEEEGWRLNLDQLDQLVTPETQVVSIVTPNNPTGSILDEHEIQKIIAAAAQADAWILADEVYAGTEQNEESPTATLFGRYKKVIAVNSLSKAYGLPGLRCGWMVAPEEIIEALWRRHEYAVVSATMLSNKLAAWALAPDVRPKLISRTRSLIKNGFTTLEKYLNVHPGVFSLVPPKASALSFVKYDLPVGSSQFVEQLRQKKNVLMIPGDCFGLDHHLRISSALPLPYLETGLSRLNELVHDYI